LLEPAQAGIRGSPTIFVFAQTRDGAVVNDFAFRIAPAAIDDLVDGNFIDVAANDPVDKLGGTGAGDAVFEQRRNVNERGGIANRVVLMFVVHLVDADGVIARPLAIAQALAQRQRAFMKSSSDRHDPSVDNVA